MDLPKSLKLHGVEVPTEMFCELERVAEEVYRHTPSEEPERDCRRFSVDLSSDVLAYIRRAVASRWPGVRVLS